MRAIPLLLLLASAAGAQPAGNAPRARGAATEATAAWIDGELPDLLELYRDLHRHPEVSFREKRTSARIADELEAAGFIVTRNIGGLGVVGVLRNGFGPTLLLRTDMDALPVGERTGLPYMSAMRTEDDAGNVAGVMHACGHDLHMTHLVGVARWLQANQQAWRGTVVCIGQPAEERGAGAQAMLEDGLYERFPRPDFALALHVSSDLAAGKVGWRAGPAMANVQSVDVRMFGRGGHGAAPHTTIDPIPQAAELVMALQTIVSREIDPQQPAVVTVGAIHGGTQHNVISDQCHLQLTVRSYDDDVHTHVLRAIRRKAEAIAAGAGAPPPEVRISEHTPALINDAELVARVVAAFREELGDANVVDAPPVMMGEDFARYGRAGVPIFLYRLGTIAPERLAAMAARSETPPSTHSPFYYPDAEPSLRTGLRATTAALRALLPAKG